MGGRRYWGLYQQAGEVGSGCGTETIAVGGSGGRVTAGRSGPEGGRKRVSKRSSRQEMARGAQRPPGRCRGRPTVAGEGPVRERVMSGSFFRTCREGQRANLARRRPCVSAGVRALRAAGRRRSRGSGRDRRPARSRLGTGRSLLRGRARATGFKCFKYFNHITRPVAPAGVPVRTILRSRESGAPACFTALGNVTLWNRSGRSQPLPGEERNT